MGRGSALRRIVEASGVSGGGGSPAVLWSALYAGVAAGQDLTVSAGVSVVYDLASSPHYGCVMIYGTVTVDQTKDTAITFDCMEIEAGGRYICGTEASPYPRTISHTVTPSGAYASDAVVIAGTPKNAAPVDSWRGIMVMDGGELCWVATVPAVNIVKLGATAAAGATSITVAVPVTLKAGEELEIGSTQYYTQNSAHARERATVAADVTGGTTVTLTTGLTYRHHGQLQYLVAPAHEDIAGTNLSYTKTTILSTDSFGTVNGNAYTGTRVLAAIAAGAPSVVDHRATCGLLTHPIKFGAPNDSDWTTHGYGAHLMVMGTTSKCRMQGVERYRVGQAGFLGRYPDHQHMRSYTRYGQSGSGTFLGDVDSATNYIKFSSTRDSTNRGSTIHGTCGFTLQGNVYSNIDTHCLFLEDGSERRNVIDGNFVSGVNPINTVVNSGSTAIKLHDIPTSSGVLNEQGPAGIWNTSPDNHVRNNIFSGTYVGIWNSFATACFGASRDVAFAPRLVTILEQANNESACAVFKCMMTGSTVLDELGSTGAPTDGHYQYGDGSGVVSNFPATISGANLWKSDYGWYGNEALSPQYLGWTLGGLSANHITFREESLGFFGNVSSGLLDHCSFFCHTLDDYYLSHSPNLILSYGGGLLRTNSVFVGKAASNVHGTSEPFNDGAVMPMWDYYVYGVTPPPQGFWGGDANNAIIGASPGLIGVRFPPVFLLSQFGSAYTALVPNDSTATRGLSGAVKLPADGCMFGQAGWWTFDSPFMLYGTTGSVYAASAAGATNLNGKLLDTSYNFYGCQIQYASNTTRDDGAYTVNNGDPSSSTGNPAINYTRLQSDAVTPVTGGTWNTPKPITGHAYPNMRHCAVMDGGIYDAHWPVVADLPGGHLPTSLQIFCPSSGSQAGAPSTGHFFLSVDWDGTISTITPSKIYVETYAGLSPHSHNYAASASKAALLASTVCSYWVDTVNNKLWLHNVLGDLNGKNAYITVNI